MRVYKRTPGSRDYKTRYTSCDVRKAVQCYNKGGLPKVSMRKVAKRYGIPYGTFRNRIKKIHLKKPGGQLGCPPKIEKRLVKAINLLKEWKVRLTGLDIRRLAKMYLNEAGITDPRFKNNPPGEEWLKCFIKRHNLAHILADSLKLARAEISRESVTKYFCHLKKSLDGVEPQNIFNYAEINIPGPRPVQRKSEHFKADVSLMHCGNTTGQFLPPMVVCKSTKYFKKWTRGRSEGMVFDCSQTGWFDARTFERWFLEIYLVHIQNVQAFKVLIGDNPASHFTASVIDECLNHNIRFVCLPPNSTDLLQPLEVAVFESLKTEWRKILENWEKESRTKQSNLRIQFPRQLSKLNKTLKGKNITAGFKACGIHPFDLKAVLKRMRSKSHIRNAGSKNVESKNILRKCDRTDPEEKKKRGKKIMPRMDRESDEIVLEDQPGPSTARISKQKSTRIRCNKSKQTKFDSSSSGSDDTKIINVDDAVGSKYPQKTNRALTF